MAAYWADIVAVGPRGGISGAASAHSRFELRTQPKAFFSSSRARCALREKLSMSVAGEDVVFL
jgi:hypothetical protein